MGFVRPDWDTYFLNIAEVVATRADCTRRQVGCVIVKDRRIVSTGYNGAPAGELGCASSGACPRGRFSHAEVPADTDYNHVPCVAVHAEANALIFARDWLQGATAYVTERPCGQCAAQLRGAGITRVVTPHENAPPVPGGTVGTNTSIVTEGV